MDKLGHSYNSKKRIITIKYLGIGESAIMLGLSTKTLKHWNKSNEFVKNTVPENIFEPIIKVDHQLSLDEINEQVISEINKLQPFGVGNPEPIFYTKAVNVINKNIVGNKAGYNKILSKILPLSNSINERCIPQPKQSIPKFFFHGQECILDSNHCIMLCNIVAIISYH